jgi:hypothetical protein
MATPNPQSASLQTPLMEQENDDVGIPIRLTMGDDREGVGAGEAVLTVGEEGEGGVKRGDTPRRSKRSTRSASSSQGQGRGSSQKSSQKGSQRGSQKGSQKRSNSARTKSAKGQSVKGQKTPEKVEYKTPSSQSVVSKMFDTVLSRTGHVGPDGRATFEAKALLTATIGTILGLIMQIIAVSTNSWMLVELPGQGLYRNATGRHLVGAYTGLWKLCRMETLREKMPDGSFKSTECKLWQLSQYWPL